MNDEELLNWAMNQLFRCARTLDLIEVGATIPKDCVVKQGCDITATAILERLKNTQTGLELVKTTNPKLLI